MKPNGIALTYDAEGVPVYRVRHASSAENLIWEAVREAVDAGMTPTQFRNKVAQAWEQAMKDDAADAMKELTR